MSSEEVKETYDRIAETYSKKRKDPASSAWNDLMEVPAMESLLRPLAKGTHALDLGCGTGLLTKGLMALGAGCVIGIDQSEEMIKIARQDFPENEFFVGTIEKLPFKERTFDLVASSLVLHYLKDLAPTIREVSRVLKPGGSFVFSLHHPFEECIRREKNSVVALPYFHNNGYYWRMCGTEFLSFHHTLENIINSLYAAGFTTQKILETRPNSANRAAFNDYEVISQYPTFLIVWAMGTGSGT